MIESLREVVLVDPGFYVALCGFFLGLILGYTVYRTNYCAMGSISDIVSFGDYRRFRAWLLGSGVAMVGLYVLWDLEISDYSQAMYLSTDFNWAANIVGGLMFGFGMVFSGGCVTKNIVRAGAGDLRSLIVLMVIGLFAYMTIGGILGPVRIALFGPLVFDLTSVGMPTQSINDAITAASGIDSGTAHLAVVTVMSLGIFIWCFKDKAFRSSPVHIASGLIIGLLVVAGWALTGLAADELADEVIALGSFTYVRPTGDTLEYLMRFTALGSPNFGVVTLIGTMLGATIGALLAGRFAYITFANPSDTKRNLFGAAFMGIGGVLALGCTVGQSLTGASTLAMGSFITFISIVIGGYLGVHALNRILMAEV